jgi:membrane-associated protease RseP (regulator of RpoE activity)
MLLSRIFGKKLSQDMEERIVGTSFVFLLLLIVVITIVDVRRFF